MSRDPRSRRLGILLVISSPSGAGKTSLALQLAANQEEIELSISSTTRAPRSTELDGREYHFVTRETFDSEVREAAFLEWAEVHGHRYGTPRAPVMAAVTAGRDLLFDIDWQGAAKIASELPQDTVRVFILPPSMSVLESRLRGRAQDVEAVIARRLAGARDEILHWSEYDYVVVNDDFERAYRQIEAIYLAERAKSARNPWLKAFVNRLTVREG